MDKSIEDFLTKIDDGKIKDDYSKTQRRIEDIIIYVQNNLRKAELNPNKTTIKNIEEYMPLVQEFMCALKDKRDFIIIKGFAKSILAINNRWQNAFSEEYMNDYIEQFQSKVDEKSKEYERM